MGHEPGTSTSVRRCSSRRVEGHRQLLKCYTQADADTMLAVMEAPKKISERLFPGEIPAKGVSKRVMKQRAAENSIA